MGTDFTDHTGRALRLTAAAVACLTLANCASSDKFASKVDPKYGVSSSPRVVEFGEPVPRGGGVYRVGKPYMVGGRMYVPEENRQYREEGLASWYGDDFHGRLTANGEVFDMTSITAASPIMPMPSYARVTNLANGKSLIVRVNDRGPYHGNRVIDVSHRAATLLDFRDNGIARVRVEYVGRAPLEGTDDRQLEATLRQGQPAPAPSAVMVASAKPFLPELPSPVRAASPRGDIPVPAERPYTLGNTAEDVASRGVTSEPTASRSTRQASRKLEIPRTLAYEPPLPSTISAYAPTNEVPAMGLVSGRGLY